MQTNSTTFFELKPKSGCSFGGKAIVRVDDDGTETLLSYDTEIIARTPDGKLIPLYNDWTATTGRHVRAFCGLSKAEYFKLAGWDKPQNWTSYWDYLTREDSYAYVTEARRLCKGRVYEHANA